jgi:hypothetical protein
MRVRRERAVERKDPFDERREKLLPVVSPAEAMAPHSCTLFLYRLTTPYHTALALFLSKLILTHFFTRFFF